MKKKFIIKHQEMGTLTATIEIQDSLRLKFHSMKWTTSDKMAYKKFGPITLEGEDTLTIELK